MKLSAVDLNLFVVFEATYTEGSLTRAADVLGITQPAVSNALARLRRVIGDPLFTRRGRGIAPTPLATEIIGPVRLALGRFRFSLDQRSTFDPATSDRLFHLAMRDTVAAALLPALVAAFARAAPSVRIQCHMLDRATIPPELAAGTIDFAIDIPELARTDLLTAPLLEDRYVCALRRGHPATKGAWTLDRFLALGHITVSGRRRGRSFVDAALSKLGRQTNTVLRLPYYQPAFPVVMNSDLVMTAPLSIAQQHDLELRPLPLDVPSLQSMLYWHRNADTDPGIAWAREEITRLARNLAPNARRGAASPRRHATANNPSG
ncbi:MAG: LysR family transcriptional regulator [Alphaproteobacteria bacterium]|nr:LysR family transcriptional regulator [Alphaproteobacteria bacterium]